MILPLLGLALAGDVYINGVKADVLPVMTMDDVTVRFDQGGNVWIDAPLYRVTLVAPAASSPAPAPAAPSTYTAPSYQAPYPAAPEAAAYVPPPAPAVGPGTWWMVTEDNDSSGHEIEVLINGAPVRRVRSGDGQVILDVGGWLRRGQNTVELRDLGTRYGGGVLVVYVGRGSDAGGTVRMDAPDVRFTRRATDSGGGSSTSSKQFTLTVP